MSVLFCSSPHLCMLEMQMQHLKRRVREIFPGTGEEIIFHDRKYRKDFYSLL